jgi:zinc transport system ATP-binding protein
MILELKSVGFFYQKTPILKNISFTINQGETIGIVGPNGGGKTTLLKILAGLITPTEGEILIDQQQAKLASFQKLGLLAYVPQQESLNHLLPLTVQEVLRLNPRQVLPVAEVLDLIGMAGKENEQVRHLSGGEKQRVLIGRAIGQQPQMLLLDEPSNGLDSKGQDQLFFLLNKLKKQFQTSLAIVDHNLAHIIPYSDKLICLNKTLHWHNQKELLTKDVLEEIYHCEFEHLLIHHTTPKMDSLDHHHQECQHQGDHHLHPKTATNNQGKA